MKAGRKLTTGRCASRAALVAEIRYLYSLPKYSVRMVSRRLGVSDSTVNKILNSREGLDR